ncbi:MAG: integration host factor subunit beta [Oxalobacteraceae bacterium]|nr:MAG: integration host factor subunit beta [Oxalobacteraceae bacterium]
MVRTQLTALLAEQHPELHHREIEAAVAAFFDSITEHLANGGRVQIRGFGSFSTRDRTAQTGRNPRTGEAVEIDARRVPHFAPGKGLRKLVDHSKT